MILDDQQFDALVSRALDQIPARFKSEMENVEVVVEARPTPHQLRRLKIRGTLLGLFDGVPKGEWGQATLGVQPSKITLFQEPILEQCRDMKQLEDTVRVVLMHEVAHYFGYNDQALCVMDQKLRRRLSDGHGHEHGHGH